MTPADCRQCVAIARDLTEERVTCSECGAVLVRERVPSGKHVEFAFG